MTIKVIEGVQYECFEIMPPAFTGKPGEIWEDNNGVKYLIKFINNPGSLRLSGAVYYKTNWTCQGPTITTRDFYSYTDDKNNLILVPNLIKKSENQDIYNFLEIKKDEA